MLPTIPSAPLEPHQAQLILSDTHFKKSFNLETQALLLQGAEAQVSICTKLLTLLATCTLLCTTQQPRPLYQSALQALFRKQLDDNHGPTGQLVSAFNTFIDQELRPWYLLLAVAVLWDLNACTALTNCCDAPQ